VVVRSPTAAPPSVVSMSSPSCWPLPTPMSFSGGSSGSLPLADHLLASPAPFDTGMFMSSPRSPPGLEPMLEAAADTFLAQSPPVGAGMELGSFLAASPPADREHGLEGASMGSGVADIFMVGSPPIDRSHGLADDAGGSFLGEVVAEPEYGGSFTRVDEVAPLVPSNYAQAQSRQHAMQQQQFYMQTITHFRPDPPHEEVARQEAFKGIQQRQQRQQQQHQFHQSYLLSSSRLVCTPLHPCHSRPTHSRQPSPCTRRACRWRKHTPQPRTLPDRTLSIPPCANLLPKEPAACMRRRTTPPHPWPSVRCVRVVVVTHTRPRPPPLRPGSERRTASAEA
jgi:hypothetical protein